MKQAISRAMNIGVLTAVAALGAGCATSGSLEEVRAMAQESKSAAESAQQTADQAQSTADSAQQTAEQAMSTAKAASQAASEAQSCCDANTERLDRMFQRVQQK
jgi:murein lipoprotein